MSDRLWLIGGTQDSKILAQDLVEASIPCVVSVTTEAARSLYPIAPMLTCHVGALSADSLPAFVRKYRVIGILDASHPFAVEISKQAIAIAQALALPYLRYERPTIDAPSLPGQLGETVDSLQTLLTSGSLLGERVLFTIGVRLLHQLAPYQDQATLFARILPSMMALEAAIAAGFTSDRLIALRPPVSPELEQALWHQWRISTVVTKASGKPGGEDIKRQVAAEQGIRCVAIARPDVSYPQQTSDLTTALAFCKRVYRSEHHI